ncbi:hypothetical protein BOTBODRAFT_66669 [Botryobasidium botryosum FD-172 SS1]|uniref:F-box domain-containing protein n=1 Tax=Botryobasidium botryosum (strain FD-172 SS1) TaxID=930990 RepID=A0A067MNI6_BOTB1|nr:hypothetical protein BOTBODRAFT_66669 [Botryobasidium botryosum FD-172 SS1]
METILVDIIPPLLQTLVDRIRQSCSLDAEKGSLGEEIKAIELASDAFNTCTARALSSLRRRQNQLTSVHRLPNEILSLIFVLAIEHKHNSSPSNHRPIRISGVCRRWRAVALGTPRLWTCIDVAGPPNMMETFFNRSGNAPLHISATMGRDPDREKDNAFYWSQHSSRWTSLALFGYDATRASKIWEWAGQAAPSLEALKVYMKGYGAPGSNPVDLFKGNVPPRLHRITLVGFYLPLTNSMFTNLTKLHLGRMLDCPGTYIVDLLQAVRASPCLEELRVEDVNPALGSATWDELALGAPSNIDLPHLQRLSLLLLEAGVVQFILARVTIPPRANLKIDMDGVPRDQDLSHIFPPRPTNLRNLQSIDMLTFASSDDRHHCVVLGGVTTDVDGGNPASLLSIGIRGVHSSGPVQKIMSSLGPTLSLMPVRLFSLEQFSSRKWSVNTLLDMLNHYPSIDALFFHSCHPKFVEALTVTSSNHPCPGLRLLGLTECAISDDALISTARSRTQRNEDACPPGVRLEHLCLSDSHGGSTAVREALSLLLEISLYSGTPLAVYVPKLAPPPTDGSGQLRRSCAQDHFGDVHGLKL